MAAYNSLLPLSNVPDAYDEQANKPNGHLNTVLTTTTPTPTSNNVTGKRRRIFNTILPSIYYSHSSGSPYQEASEISPSNHDHDHVMKSNSRLLSACPKAPSPVLYLVALVFLIFFNSYILRFRTVSLYSLSHSSAFFYFLTIIVLPLINFRLFVNLANKQEHILIDLRNYRVYKRYIFVCVLKSICVSLVIIIARLHLFPFPHTPFPYISPSGSTSPAIAYPQVPYCNSTSYIDVVYTWVNVSDPVWQNLASSFDCPVTGYINGGGDVDIYEALKHSMRSVYSHLPFIRNIYIITERPQIPFFLQLKNTGDHYMSPRTYGNLNGSIYIIFHDEFMPDECVPTFNSQPTEFYLHRFLDRTQRSLNNSHSNTNLNCFLYMNDDFLINRDSSITYDFINERGEIRFTSFVHVSLPFPLTYISKFIDMPIGMFNFHYGDDDDGNEENAQAFIIDPHTPYVIHAQVMEQFLVSCGSDCMTYCRSRCVRKGPLAMRAYQNFLMEKHPYLLSYFSPFELWIKRLPLGLPRLPRLVNDMIMTLFNPMFLYIESHDNIENDPYWSSIVFEYLHTNLPTAAPWER